MDLNESTDTILTVHFPLAGIEAATIYGGQPARPTEAVGYARTTAEATNVRAFDFLDRCRGGSRPGLKKFVPTLPGDPTRIQYLGVLIDPQADALWGSYRSVFIPTDGSDPYYIFSGAPGPGFPGPAPSYPFFGPWPVDPEPGQRDPKTGVWDGPNVTPDPGVLVGGVRVRTGGSLVTIVQDDNNAYGWPCDQMIRAEGDWYALGDRAVAGPDSGYGWNADSPRGWRGPTFPDAFTTTPKGIILAKQVYNTYQTYMQQAGDNFALLLSGITDEYTASLDAAGWYTVICGTSPEADRGFLGIPSSSREASGLPVLQAGGTYGRLAIVFVWYDEAGGSNDPFLILSTGTTPPDPIADYTLLDTFDSVVGMDTFYMGAYARTYLADLLALWEGLADSYDRIDVLSIHYPMEEPPPGTPEYGRWLNFQQSYAQYSPHLQIPLFMGSAATNLTTATIPVVTMMTGGWEQAAADATLTAILNWLDNLP